MGRVNGNGAERRRAALEHGIGLVRGAKDRGFSVASSNGCSLASSNGFSLVQRHLPKDCHLFNGISSKGLSLSQWLFIGIVKWTFTGIVQWFFMFVSSGERYFAQPGRWALPLPLMDGFCCALDAWMFISHTLSYVCRASAKCSYLVIGDCSSSDRSLRPHHWKADLPIGSSDVALDALKMEVMGRSAALWLLILF